MTTARRKLRLCMIVKDEAPGIGRCLASGRPLVDGWIGVDRGPCGGSQDIVRAAMAGLAGTRAERPWVDLACDRSEVPVPARMAGGR